MIFFSPDLRRLRLSTGVWLGLLTVVASGYAWGENSAPLPIDRATVTKIEVRFSTAQLGELSSAIDIFELEQRVSSHLAEWHYPMTTAHTEKSSHQLTATMGTIQLDVPPVGFSFSSGNSDPRSLNFQKARVLPITCELSSNSTPRQQAVLKTTVSAEDFLSNAYSASDKLSKISNEISTVCFNLLSGLKLPTPSSANDTPLNKPRWLPNVSIEVKPVPALTSQSSPQVDTSVVNVEPKPPVLVEQNEERKQLIIHNQGSPLILELGHQRR